MALAAGMPDPGGAVQRAADARPSLPPRLLLLAPARTNARQLATAFLAYHAARPIDPRAQRDGPASLREVCAAGLQDFGRAASWPRPTLTPHRLIF
eukprot:5829251-Pyramimonas_sp.AAC.1